VQVNWFSGFCDRCGKFCNRLRNHHDHLCGPCEAGSQSLAAHGQWARPMTSSEVQLAYAWALIERGG
jgi:hypothetical protein